MGRFLLGVSGVLGALRDTAAGFDGASGGMAGTGPALAGRGTMEGWFRWRAGTTVMRDNTGPSGGWLLAFNSNGELRYRVGGSGFATGRSIDTVRDGRWHHLVARKSGRVRRAVRRRREGALGHRRGLDRGRAALARDAQRHEPRVRRGRGGRGRALHHRAERRRDRAPLRHRDGPGGGGSAARPAEQRSRAAGRGLRAGRRRARPRRSDLPPARERLCVRAPRRARGARRAGHAQPAERPQAWARLAGDRPRRPGSVLARPAGAGAPAT